MFMQGELNVTDHCCKMKTMDDTLWGMGHDMSDRQLALNVLHGLS
jgi:hypothetical protein